MKLVSSSPKTRHTHTVKPNRGWFLKRLRSRLSSTKTFTRICWVLLVVIVAAFAISVFTLLRHALENALIQ